MIYHREENTMLELAVQNDIKLSDAQYQLVSDTVYRHCGIKLHQGKKELVQSRLAKLVRKNKASSYAEYLDNVMSDLNGPVFSEFINSLTTNLTMFFRESHHFEYLSKEFLPNLMQSKMKRRDFKIRAWSAGCSSGEESYSLAMSLNDALTNVDKWNVKILATDISSSILEKARKGIYDKEKTASIPPAFRTQFIKYDTKNPSQGAVSGLLKNMISFRYLNLIQKWPFRGPFDFIFCRNVMIYFDKKTQEELVSKFWQVLAPGGLLFTGHSESLTGIHHQFKYVRPTIYQKV
jgi:chemotaxis protein methyltransferase CheR